MSALPNSIQPPMPLTADLALVTPGGLKVIEQALVNETIADLREAVNMRQAVDFGDGSAPRLAQDAIMAAVPASPDATELLQIAMRASNEKAAHAARAWASFYAEALDACAHELVEHIAEGRRVIFGPMP